MGQTPVLAGQRTTASLLNSLPTAVAPLVTGSVSNSAAEAVIGTFTIPAGDIAAVGNGYSFRVVCTADSNGTGPPTVIVKMRLGTAGTTADTILYTYATITERTGASTNLVCTLDGWFYFTAVGASGTAYGQGMQSQNITSGTDAPPNWALSVGITADTTSSLKLTTTAIWNTASTANIFRTLTGGLYRI